ncbi:MULTISPECIES: hypothetical protein [Methanoculleus]|jgi:hypothetical protein|uniref:Uncharacterized protein n=2 Tax=Methanoculleus thermophilus TaxID=2200 RepID=A0A1G9C4V4_9EURY|nr:MULTISPECIES: hypothetical protein [Methanoculleus]NLN08512.1 hypothetical protein [Methanoculleus thermophilus]SDK46702.1 hypothetical protein SAMN04488571_11264 [Methanoculleus thermophilus]HQD26905.1 hypothetical protein [Methanoculleus thermophilus]
MLDEIEATQQRAVMAEIEEMIQSMPEYTGVREALLAMNFIPERDDADVTVWVQPDLKIFVLLKMNLGGGYAGYRVGVYDEPDDEIEDLAVYNAR